MRAILISLGLIIFQNTRAQTNTNENHPLSFQKIIFQNNSLNYTATRISDSLSIFGYVKGYDDLASRNKGQFTFFRFGNSQETEVPDFTEILRVDTIKTFRDYSLPVTPHESNDIPRPSVLFVLMGNEVSGAFWLFDLYYSEILNHAGVQFTEKTKVLCVYPWEKKASVHYRIVAIEENDNGQYEISYTYLNYTNPLEPKIEKSGSAMITKDKFITKLKEQLMATSAVDVKNQCASPGLPRLVALPEKRFFYSLPCLDQHGRERADEPMDLSLYVEKLFYKYLYEK